MRKKIIVTTAALLITFNITVYAGSTDTYKNQIKENQETIKILEQKKQELSNDKSQILSELQIIMEKFAAVAKETDALEAAIKQKESEIIARETSINEMNSKISLLEDEILTSETEIIQKEAELFEKNAILDSRVRAAYMDGSVGNILFTLIESDSILDFTDRLLMINKVVEMDNEIIQQIVVIKEELASNKAALELNKKDLTDTKAVIEKEKTVFVEEKEKLETEKQALTAKLSELKGLEDEKAGLINTLTDEVKDIATEIGDTIEENKELQNDITALIKAEAKKNASVQESTNSSGYIKPVSGRVTSSFGYRIHPILGYKKLHTGIDFAATAGTPIKASRAGTVIRASYNSSYGNHVIIDHGNGVTTLYAHMSALNTRNGAKVSQGQVIGYVGSTGMSTGPHLHLEFRLNGNLVNPAPYLGL
jgi:murein DD-endopeptidase MepM/ murein hydrolase activator NlpD